MIRASLAFVLVTAPALADPAVIEDASAEKSGSAWRFSVTLSHGDTGWDDYADAWRVVLEDGTVLGERILLHPHVNEQPFTRSLGDVEVPQGTAKVFIEARTFNEPYGDQRFPVDLD